MDIIELVLTGEEVMDGVDTISIVDEPAIESDFIALSKNGSAKMASGIRFSLASAERRILMGPALIPNRMILRKTAKGEPYYIHFSSKTVRQASELFLKNGFQRSSSVQHAKRIAGATVVESWIVEDQQADKSALYGLNVPTGTWMVAMKVENDDIWEDWVKTKKLKGFSIEGYFADSRTVGSDKH